MKDFFKKIGKVKDECKNVLIELLWRRKFLAFFVYGGILLNAVSWLILFQLTELNQEVVILHYNAYLGIDIMLNTANGFYPDLFLVPIGGLIFLFLDIFLAGILLCLSDLGNKQKVKDKCNNDAEEIDVNLLGSKLIIIGGFLTQMAIFVYSLAILFVN